MNLYFQKEIVSVPTLSENININMLVGEPADDELCLCYGDKGLSLRRGSLSLTPDLSENVKRLTKANIQSELLVKAAKLKEKKEYPVLLDATAGLGEDSLILASAGFNVKMYEYDSVIASLLRDALARGADIPALRSAVSRMTLYEKDSVVELNNLSAPVDVVLLDPMFPERQKSSLVKKKFQLLQCLECPCADEIKLLDAAFAANPYKIVIKRPQKGQYLAGKKPDYSLEGKAVRYDVFVRK